MVTQNKTKSIVKKVRGDSDTILEKIESLEVKWYDAEQTPEEQPVWPIASAIKRTIDYYESYLFPIKTDIIKQKYLNSIDRAVYMKQQWLRNRSNRIYPLIASVHDTFVSNLYEVETTPRIVARNKDDQERASVVQDCYDWFKDVSWYDAKMKTIKAEASLIGTAYSRSWYQTITEKIQWNDKWKVKSVVNKISKPTVDHVSFFQLFYDPFAPSFDNTPRKAYRYISNITDVVNKYWFLWEEDNWLHKLKGHIRGWTPFSHKDYTRIYSSKNYERELSRINSVEQFDDWIENRLFAVDFSDQELVEVVEYWSDDQFVLLLNWVTVYDGLSPYPFSGDPFSILVHEEVPWSIQWIGIGDKLLNHQHQANTIFSWVEDAMRMHLYPMYIVSKWALKDSAGRPLKSIPYEPEKVLEDASNLSNGWIDTLKYVDFNFINTYISRLQWLVAEAYEIVWLNTYTQWGNGKMERSAAWVTQKVAIIRTRLLWLIESLNWLNSRVFNHWLAIAVTKFDKDFSFRILTEDGKPVWRELDLESVLQKYDVIAESDAMRLATKELRATQALNTLNQITAVNVDPLSGLPIYNVRKLIDEVMSKLDFDWGEAYTDEEIIDAKNRALKIQQMTQPPQPEVAPQPPVIAPEPWLTPQTMTSETPEDAWMLASMMRQWYQWQ